DHKIVFGQNDAVHPLECGGKFLDEIEKPFFPGFYVSAVLDVVRRPKLLSCGIITSVEQRVERLQDKPLVLLSCCLHFHDLMNSSRSWLIWSFRIPCRKRDKGRQSGRPWR